MPRPLRQIDETIPRELERICLKALAKRAADRYTDGEGHGRRPAVFLGSAIRSQPSVDAGWARRPFHAPVRQPSSRLQASSPSALLHSAPTPTSGQSTRQIVPKGLRSFDEHDADFFLELLPGPRDREGLPDSIRFWKTRIEETDPDSTFCGGSASTALRVAASRRWSRQGCCPAWRTT